MGQKELTLSDLILRYCPDSTLLSIKKGEAITTTLQPAQYFYVLKEGVAKLIYEEANTKAIILDIFHADDFFGEMEILGLSYYDRSIIALTDCELYKITKEQFIDLHENHPVFSLHILRVLCERLLQSGDSKINAEFMFLRDKVFRLIQDNLDEKGRFLYSKDVLAEMAGVSIRSLNRSLAELQDKKLIVVTSGSIHLDM